MHPADEFEAFHELADNRGWSAADIAARFGVSEHVVRQRLKLGAVSPKLMQVYREGGLNLDQLQASPSSTTMRGRSRYSRTCTITGKHGLFAPT